MHNPIQIGIIGVGGIGVVLGLGFCGIGRLMRIICLALCPSWHRCRETQRDASCAQCQRILDKLLALNHAHLAHLLTIKPQASSSSSCSSVRSSV